VTKRIFDAWGEWVHEKTLLSAGIVRVSVKDCFDTPTQTLPDHGFHHLQHWKRSPGPREEVLRAVSSSAHCSSKQPRIVVLSTPTSFGVSHVQPYLVCHQFRWRVFTSETSSTRRSSACCMPNANIANRALFGSFHALAGIPGHHLKLLFSNVI
jgi:hypothetical protein